MLTLLRNVAIGRKVRKALIGITTQERFAGASPAAIIDLSTELQGEFEIIVRRRS